MEARDTVPEILPHSCSIACPHCGEEFGMESDIEATKMEQAEATWPIAEKAGMLKVVEWIDKEIPMTLQNLRRWQTFLKEQVFK